MANHFIRRPKENAPLAARFELDSSLPLQPRSDKPGNSGPSNVNERSIKTGPISNALDPSLARRGPRCAGSDPHDLLTMPSADSTVNERRQAGRADAANSAS